MTTTTAKPLREQVKDARQEVSRLRYFYERSPWGEGPRYRRLLDAAESELRSLESEAIAAGEFDMEMHDYGGGWRYGRNCADKHPRHFLVRGDVTLRPDWGVHPMSRIDVALWLALDCPPRQGPHELSREDLMHLAAQRLTRAAEAA